MYALVDCNSFFCSVEQAFHPGLRGKPVCVLSSNDGCIVALTPEAKALGLRRGDPLFKVQSIVRAHNVAVFSSNMTLYAAMSKRVTSILRHSIAHVENYSIDESFCDLRGYDRHHSLETMMRDIADRILLWTDIPVSVGVAPTKTLAKIGSRFAKKYPGYRSVCMIDNEDKRRTALGMTAIGDVWGIGRHSIPKLAYHGIHTALDLADKSMTWARSNLRKPEMQTWHELNGTACIDTTEAAHNQSLCCSRSFGRMVDDIDSLKASVATFAAGCAGKLRGQHTAATSVTVFLCSNRFRDDMQQYSNAATETLPVPTSDTMEITQAALTALGSIFRPGVMYKKSGVAVGGITSASAIQQNMFDNIPNRMERGQLMKAIDSINRRYGAKTIHLMAEGERGQAWQTRCEHRSGDYLTDITQLLTIRH
ncbi:MAG: Y-family DNA polymerase [Prevotellaceae bacterium]|nr:Y-family DNA polymerase [Prevotellaceae bacterium]